MKRLTPLLLFACLLLTGCQTQQPVLVGFVNELSGRDSVLGVQARNGAYLAVEDINNAGGINGRPVELLVQDDEGLAETARQADRELIAAGVSVIIGHGTSTLTSVGQEITEPAGIVLFSPAATSNRLSTPDDLLFRGVTDNDRDIEILAQLIYNYGDQRLAILYDIDNSLYARLFGEEFRNQFEAQGGNITQIIGFSKETNPDLSSILRSLSMDNPDALLIVASSVNTAVIAQQTDLIGWDVSLYACDWAYSNQLAQIGGKAVEGIRFLAMFDINSSTEAMQNFRERYLETFGEEPMFTAGLAYESMIMAAEGLRHTNGQAEGLAEALMDLRDVPGLNVPLNFDENGDIRRPLYLLEVEDGDLQTLAAFPIDETP